MLFSYSFWCLFFLVCIVFIKNAVKTKNNKMREIMKREFAWFVSKINDMIVQWIAVIIGMQMKWRVNLKRMISCLNRILFYIQWRKMKEVTVCHFIDRGTVLYKPRYRFYSGKSVFSYLLIISSPEPQKKETVWVMTNSLRRRDTINHF